MKAIPVMFWVDVNVVGGSIIAVPKNSWEDVICTLAVPMMGWFVVAFPTDSTSDLKSRSNLPPL